MKILSNRYEVLNSSDSEIISFFKKSSFRGLYMPLSDEESTQFAWACGKVSNITINSQVNDICPKIIFVPKQFETYVTQGPCEFKAIVDLKALRSVNQFYRLLIKRIQNVSVVTPKHDEREEKIFRRNLKLKDNRFVGQFIVNSDGSVKITDIRRTDFSKLILQNGKNQDPIVYHPKTFKPISGRYYEFTWVLNGVRENYVYLFKVDETQPLKEVTPKDLVTRLHNDIMNYPPGAGQKIVKMLDTLKNQLTASGKEIFIYELLQNANDYPQINDGNKQPVDVEFHLTLTSLVFMHTGASFNEKNIAAICSINDKEKDTNKDTIGYKGIGFKTVFVDNENVYLQSAGYSFRFDRQASKDIVDTAWQILPIWTQFSELTPAEKAIFTLAKPDFRVKFALTPTRRETLRDIPNSYEQMFRKVFANERVILFIPNLASVKVYLHGTNIPDIICNQSSDKWQVDSFEDTIDEEITSSINKDIEDQEKQGGLKIPTKYFDFKQTKVSFACEIDAEHHRLKPVQDSCLYCYLPAKEAKWGLKFLLNTDMIPNGARDNIETEFDNSTNVNEEIARIAGSKFFDWICSLCRSNKYEYNSVFNLIPNFASIKRGRDKFKELISEFQNGFEVRLKDEVIIPSDGGFIKLTDTILDETGLSSSGIVKDEEFLQFLDLEDVALSDLSLRPDTAENKAFHSFLKNYIEEFGVEKNIFDLDALTKMVRTESFQEWLKNQENNNRFLNFLLERNYLQDFLDEKIFLEADGGLYSASELYYDIDKYLTDLDAFTDYLYYLSSKTREYFAENSKWDDAISGVFAKFDENKFVDDILLDKDNIETTRERLKDFDTSVHFFNFLATYVDYKDNYKQLPFFNANGNVVESFEDKFVFFHNIEGETLCASKWLKKVVICFISDSYSEVAKSYFKKFDVQDYSDDIIIKDIILSEDYFDDISSAIDENIDLSVDFINFCFKNNDIIPSFGLKSYTLNVYDCNGDSAWYINDNDVYFPSSQFDYYSQKEWIDSSWLTCLNGVYIPDKFAEDEYKRFFTDAFGIEELNDVNFYKNIVKKNLTDLFGKIKGNADKDGHKNIDFVNYLDENYNLIFEEENDAKLFSALVIASEGGFDVKLNDASLYIYSEDLADIIGLPWFPDKVVTMTHHGYGESKALEKLGIARYTFSDFYDKVLVGNLVSINNKISTIDNSVAFHNFIIEHKKSLLDEQLAKMKDAKVFLQGVDAPALKATGHKILSNKANELVKLGIVQGAALDLIAAEYEPESNLDYWETHLKNSRFTLSHFATWLNNNRNEFEVSLKTPALNISFWRWLKNNYTDSLLKESQGLPILVIDEEVPQSGVIFFSDSYLGDSKIESTVRRFNNTARFLSPSYIQKEDNISEWKDFFTKIGIKFEVVDILIETIDKSIATVKDENLIKLITDNRDALETHYEDNLVKHLHDLRVQAKDGFYPIKDTVLINYDLEEPFPYITIPYQISFSYPKENRLIDDLMQDIEGKRIQSYAEWQQLKLDYYLSLQDINEDLIRPIHFPFVNDLAIIRNSSTDSLSHLSNIEKIKILDRQNSFCEASTLTIGSKYNPFFDFEKCGVSELKYVSDEYIGVCQEYVGRFFGSIKMHRDFTEADINYLALRSCAIYFWGQYLAKPALPEHKISDIRKFITEHKFDSVTCIPTKDGMKRPSELYYGADVDWFINKIEDWENKTPLTELPDVKIGESGISLFGLLPFKKSLDFLDALYALFNVQSKERRPQLLRWMIEGFDSSYLTKIQEYRNDKLSTWKNSQGGKIQIKDLYALEYGKKNLDQYFGSNPKIIDKEYLPTGESFRTACDILQIKTITEDDFTMDPVNDTLCTRYDSDLRLFALIIAGIIDSKNWADIYAGYLERLDTLKLHRCDSILIKCNYDSSINQNFKQFYHKKDDSDFYFVDDVYDILVFQDFVNELFTYLEIEGIQDDLVKQVMRSRDNALRIVMNYHSLISNEDFSASLISFAPQLKDKLIKKEESSEDDETMIIRPEFRTSVPSEQDIHTLTNDIDGITGQSNPVVNESEDSKVNSTSNQAPEDKEPQLEEPDDSQSDNTTKRESFNTEPSSNIGTSKLGTGMNGKSEDDVPLSDKESPADYVYDPDGDEHIGSVLNDPDYDRIGAKLTRPRNSYNSRRHPKPYTKDEVDRMRSNPSPLALESLSATDEEIEILSQMNITPEQIADTNYLAQLRLYQNLIQRGDVPEETREEFVRNAADVTTHKLEGGKYIHTCSAARGVMYIPPSVWDKMMDDRWTICVYLDGKGSKFAYINSREEFLQLVEKDDVVIKITGKEKVEVVNQLYSTALNGVKSTAYTLIRVASTTNMDAVFAHYVGSMAERNDGNEIIEENLDEYGC